MNPVIEKLPVLILSPHSRCNCRCVMCDIWKTTDAREIAAADLERHIGSIERLGVEWVVFTGGEPLMHSDLFRLCAILRSRGIRITILSTGLLLERHASAIVENVGDVIVSLDGPPEIHDRVRRVPGAFQMLRTGIGAIRTRSTGFPITARCTVQKSNCHYLGATVDAARELGLDSISFLAADLTSEAFNRPDGWTAERQSGIALTSPDLIALENQIQALIASGQCGKFVAESPRKLQRIADHFGAYLGRSEETAPICNAPWVSAVVETDGTVRPCFFHRPVGTLEGGNDLIDIINGPRAMAFRAGLDVASNPVCRRCVCSLNWKATD
jgi:MoaA/NifB/PqqE/SkfB family radical SAM enzyme